MIFLACIMANRINWMKVLNPVSMSTCISEIGADIEIAQTIK